MNVTEVCERAKELRLILLESGFGKEYIDPQYGCIPRPYHPSPAEPVKLIILGQDPTIQNPNSRAKVDVVLNLDKSNSLRTYISGITRDLGIDIDKNVYATNLLKCFFKEPPAKTKELVAKLSEDWIDLLIEELEVFPNVPILTLGQPVVEALVTGGSKKVREYWGYRPNNQYDPSLFKCSSPRDNRLSRLIIAFPHIRSSSKEFYKGARPAFTKFVRDTLFP